MGARIVMDIDDTISTHRNRDYENAIPNENLIKKMQKLADEGIEFVLYTARGQISCNGNLEKIEQEKGPTLRKWLEKHKVPYAELKFGKPIADVYVDDGAMTPEEFVNGDFTIFKGGSNELIRQLGKYVIKECVTVDTLAVGDWFEKARKYGYNVPKIYAKTYNKVRMEYIHGTLCNEIPFSTDNVINRIAGTILSFAGVPGNYVFDIEAYEQRLDTHKIGDTSSLFFVETAKTLIENNASKIKATFCHGDLTSMNAILNNDNIYLIDPTPNEKYSSYLIDLAKLRMSINGYNYLFYNPNMKQFDMKYLKCFDRMIENLGLLDIVKILEFTCWVRLIKYRSKNHEEYKILCDRLYVMLQEEGVLYV